MIESLQIFFQLMQRFDMHGLEDHHWLVVHGESKMFTFQINIIMIHSPTEGSDLQ
jgi:hypothetical protein